MRREQAAVLHSNSRRNEHLLESAYEQLRQKTRADHAERIKKLTVPARSRRRVSRASAQSSHTPAPLPAAEPEQVQAPVAEQVAS